MRIILTAAISSYLMMEQFLASQILKLRQLLSLEVTAMIISIILPMRTILLMAVPATMYLLEKAARIHISSARVTETTQSMNGAAITALLTSRISIPMRSQYRIREIQIFLSL